MSEIRAMLRAVRPARIRRVVSFFLPYVRSERAYFAAALASSVVAVIFMLAQPWPLKLVFDYVLYHKRWQAELLPHFDLLSVDKHSGMLVICGLYLGIALGRAVAEYYKTLTTNFAGQRIVFALRAQLYDHMQRLSVRFHQTSQSGDLLMRLTGDIILLREMLVGAVISLVSNTIILAVTISAMFYLDPFLALISVGILPFLVFSTYYFGTRLRDASRRQRRKESQVATMGTEMLHGVRAVQAFNRERIHRKAFEQQNRGSFRQGMRATRLEAQMARSVELLLAVGTVLVLWFGVARVRETPPQVTPGDLIVFLAYLRIMYRPIRDFAKVANRTAKAAASGERVMEILRMKPDIADAPDAVRAPRFRGEIVLDDVRFAYGNGPAVLKGVNLTIAARQKVGIVGLSGAGKTTILSLLPRFIDPTGGRVLIDGQDIRTVTLASLRKQISPVFQESLLFGTTVFENIAFGSPEATAEEVKWAAVQAQAHTFISRLPDSYQTIIAERGGTLSEGQKQRIALARAFLREAPILILDEPTSNVDAKSEKMILRAIRRLARKRTTIVTTHNLKMLEFVDRILVIDHGTIAEDGTHADLIAAGGLYAQLIEMRKIVPSGDSVTAGKSP